jgi:hypothetical protein
VLHVTQKKGDHGNMINCLKVDQRQQWVDHLFEQNCITTTKQYNAKQPNKNRLTKRNRNNDHQTEGIME